MVGIEHIMGSRFKLNWIRGSGKNKEKRLSEEDIKTVTE